jgi:hypothetical protein
MCGGTVCGWRWEVKDNKSSSNHQIGQDPRGPIMRARYRRANREGKFQFHFCFCGYGMMNLEKSTGMGGDEFGSAAMLGESGSCCLLLQFHQKDMQHAVSLCSWLVPCLTQKKPPQQLAHWYSTWGVRTPGVREDILRGKRNHFTGYVKFKIYIYYLVINTE